MATVFIPAQDVDGVLRNSMQFEHDHLYMICVNQGDTSSGYLALLKYNTTMEYILQYGVAMVTYSDVFESYGYYGVHAEDILYDYTEYKTNTFAAIKIQKAWSSYRRQRAAKIIQSAWKNWQVKKRELWNPTCFIGLAYLAFTACKDIKDII